MDPQFDPTQRTSLVWPRISLLAVAGLILVIAGVWLVLIDSPAISPTPTLTVPSLIPPTIHIVVTIETPSPTPSMTPTETPTLTPTPLPTPTLFPTFTPTATPTPTDTPVPTPPAYMIEDFEYPNVNVVATLYWVNAPGNVLNYSLVPSLAGYGGQALELDYKIQDDPPSDYAGMEKYIGPAMDWRGYSRLCLWISNNYFPGDLVFQFREIGGEVWRSRYLLNNVLTQSLCFSFADDTFQLAEFSTRINGRLDLSAVDNYAFYLGNGGMGEGTVTVDRIRLEP